MPGYKNALVVVAILALLSACESSEDKANGFVESGRQYMENGDLEAAKIEFNNAVKQEQDNVEALYGLALIVEKEKNWSQVERFLTRVIELDPRFIDARVRLANLYLGANRIDAALEQSKAIAKLAPDNLQGKVINAAVSYRIGNAEVAAAEARGILKEDPHNVDATVMLANDYLSSGEYQKALDLLNVALAEQPDNLILNIIKVRTLSGMKDLEGSVAVLRHLIDLHPDNVLLPELVARQYLAAGQEEKALEVLESFAKESQNPRAVIGVIEIVNRVEGMTAATARLRQYVQQYPELPELRFALADLYIATGEMAEAEELISQLAVSDNKAVSLRAKNRLARIYLVQGRHEQAEGLVNEVLQLEPRNVSAVVTRAELAMGQGNVEQAVRSLRAATRHAPESTELMVALGKAHERQGELGLANDYLARAANQGHGVAETAAYAGFLMRQKRWQQADNLLSPVVEAGTVNEHILKLAAQAKLNTGKWDEAQQVADRLDQIGAEQGVGAQIRGLAYSGKNELDSAIESLTVFQQSAPNTLRPMATLVDAYIRAGKRQDAENFLNAILETDHDNFFALLLKGSLHAYYHEYEQAQKQFSTAVEKHPGRLDGYVRLTRVLVRQEKYDRALEVVQAGLNKFPDNLSLNISNASIQKLMGNADASIAVYENLVKRNDKLDLAVNNLAMLLVEKGGEENLRRAAGLAERFRNSKIPHFKDTLGWIHVLRAQHDQAVPLLREAADGLPDTGEVQYHLGVAYFRAGEADLARQTLKRALSLAPSDSSWGVEAERVLAEL